MSRTAAAAALTVVRGQTWEDYFQYLDENEVAIDLTGYEARLQVRTVAGQYGSTTTTTLLLDLNTVDDPELLYFDTAAEGILRIKVPAADHADLNPTNLKRKDYSYALEVYQPAGAEPRYSIPLAQGRIKALGWGVR